MDTKLHFPSLSDVFLASDDFLAPSIPSEFILTSAVQDSLQLPQFGWTRQMCNGIALYARVSHFLVSIFHALQYRQEPQEMQFSSMTVQCGDTFDSVFRILYPVQFVVLRCGACKLKQRSDPVYGMFIYSVSSMNEIAPSENQRLGRFTNLFFGYSR